MINQKMREELILEFRSWLVSNRSYLQSKLRKYNAIRYYIVTMALGFGVFVINTDFANPINLYWSIPVILFFVLSIIFSYQISERLSGLNELKALPIYKSETQSHWFQNISDMTGNSHSLLKDFNVAKAIKYSKRGRIHIPVYYSAMVCIADAVKDEKNTPEIT